MSLLRINWSQKTIGSHCAYAVHFWQSLTNPDTKRWLCSFLTFRQYQCGDYVPLLSLNVKAGNDSVHIDWSHVPFKFSRRLQCRIHIKIHPDHCSLLAQFNMEKKNVPKNQLDVSQGIFRIRVKLFYWAILIWSLGIYLPLYYQKLVYRL